MAHRHITTLVAATLALCAACSGGNGGGSETGTPGSPASGPSSSVSVPASSGTSTSPSEGATAPGAPGGPSEKTTVPPGGITVPPSKPLPTDKNIPLPSPIPGKVPQGFSSKAVSTLDGSLGDSFGLTRLRFGDHGSYIRIVADFEGANIAGMQYSAGWTDHAIYDGSGHDVVIPGATKILEVRMRPVFPSPALAVDGSYEKDFARHNHGTAIKGLEWAAPWEGDSTFYIGATEELPFKITKLDNPARFVVDIAYTK